MKLKLLYPAVVLLFCCHPNLFAGEQGDDNPTGVSGIYNGQITTAGNYDPYTGNAMRVVDDIVVPGSMGAYPLKWTRYFNSHVTWRDNTLGGAWRFSYLDYKHGGGYNPCTPDGRRISPAVYGMEEWVESPYPYNTRTLHLADGGKVILNTLNTSDPYFYPVQLVDPYGQVTTLSWVTDYVTGRSKLDKVTEPGGRYLKINWDATNSYITSVQAFDGINSQPSQSVTYTWSNFTLASGTVKVLTRVDYSDGTYATYTYTDQGYPGAPICSYPNQSNVWHVADLATADDVRYNGPMRQIAYQYYAGTGGSNKTRILSEKNLVTREAVSTISGVANISGTTTATETRGDGATRTLNYYSAHQCIDCPPPDSNSCPDPQPTDGKLSSYTDFLRHTTTLTYDTTNPGTNPSCGFINSVTDANNHTTTYTRQTGSWGITQVTHPDGSYIMQTYWPNNS